MVRLHSSAPLFLALLLVSPACGSSPAPARPPAARELPSVDGVVVYDAPVDRAPRSVRTAIARTRELLALVAPPAPADASPASLVQWANHAMRPFVEEASRAYQAARAASEAVDGADRATAAFLLGLSAVRFSELVADFELPEGVDAEIEAALRDAAAEAVAPIAVVAAREFRVCAAAEVPAVLAAMQQRCAEGAAEPPAQTEAVALTELPAECWGEELPPDPEGLEADRTAPAEIGIEIPANIAEPDRSRLRAAIESRLGSQRVGTVIASEEMARAEALVADRRWTADGPQCGRPPPLFAVLGGAHPHLIAASPRASCTDHTRNPECTLELWFRRIGSDDLAGGVPQPMYARLRDGSVTVDSMVAAAAHLRPGRDRAEEALVLTSVDRELTVLDHADEDPFLLTGRMFQHWMREPIAQCVGDRVAVLEIALEVGADGSVSDATVSTAAGDAIASCVRDVVAHSAWPCPRSGEPTRVEVRVCVDGPQL